MRVSGSQTVSKLQAQHAAAAVTLHGPSFHSSHSFAASQTSIISGIVMLPRTIK
jgi:hypothetical protein